MMVNQSPLLSFLAISFIKNLKIGDPLSLYVFTQSPAVYEKIFASINCGHAVVNDTFMNAGVEGTHFLFLITFTILDLPFGGVNESGLGSYHGIHSFRAFTREQGFFIRGISNDLINYPKYQNTSGDVKSKWYHIVRYALEVSLPSPLCLKLRRLVKLIIGKKSLVAIIFFLLGYKTRGAN